MRKLLLASVALLGLTASAIPQGVNQVPQVGAISTVYRLATYTGSGVGMVPAASGTDFFCLNGSTSKTVSLKMIVISGTAGTAITTPVLLNLNHSLDTSGTANTGLALPVPVPINANDAAATATMTSYSANPTVNDSTPNLLGVMTPTFQVTTTANLETIYEAPTGVDFLMKGFDIPPAATVVKQICLNLNGKSVSSGVVNVTFYWTES